MTFRASVGRFSRGCFKHRQALLAAVHICMQELLTALEDGTPPKAQHSHAAHPGTAQSHAPHPVHITCPAQGQKPLRLSTDYSQLLTLPAQQAGGAISRDCSANGAGSDVQRRQGHSTILHATPLAVTDSPGSCSSRPCGQLQTNLAASWQAYFSQKASMAPVNSAGRASPGEQLTRGTKAMQYHIECSPALLPQHVTSALAMEPSVTSSPVLPGASS